MLRATLPAIPGVNLVPGVRKHGSTLPDTALARHGVRVDRAHLEAYAEVCGFRVGGTLPLPYPHLLAFGLQLQLMTDPAFPFPAIGLVHVENAITAHRAIATTEALDVVTRPSGLRPHRRGQVFDLVTSVSSAGDLVWEETSTFLRRGTGDDEAPGGPLDDLEVVPSSGTQWRLAGDLGRRYAAVSGDRNPIHLYGLTAKAFGFPRQIAHGMWSLSRCVAALEGRLPDAVTVRAAFRKPVLLPGTVALGTRRDETGYTFSLTSPTTGAPHLVGTAG